MDAVKEFLASKGINLSTKLLNGDALSDWLHNKIDEEISCIEDLEMTEGIEHKFLRGRVSAFQEVLEIINK